MTAKYLVLLKCDCEIQGLGQTTADGLLNALGLVVVLDNGGLLMGVIGILVGGLGCRRPNLMVVNNIS